MKFRFTATIESPSYRSVFHLLVREAGAAAEFDVKEVIAEYEGTTGDETFKSLLELYEAQPIHLITLSTR